MKKWTMLILLGFSIHAYADQMYVKKDTNGDLIYSNKPIPEEPKPVTTPETKDAKSKQH